MEGSLASQACWVGAPCVALPYKRQRSLPSTGARLTPQLLSIIIRSEDIEKLDWTASRWDLDLELRARQEAGRRAEWATGLQAAESTLHDRLGKLGLDLFVMQGDGNCQYRAIAHSLYGVATRGWWGGV